MNAFFIIRVLFLFYYCFKANSSSLVMFITKGFAPVPINLKGKEQSAQTEEQLLAGIHPLVLSIPQSSPQLLYKGLLRQAGLQRGLTRQVCRRQLRRRRQIKFSLSPISSFWPVFPGTAVAATVLFQANKQFSALPQQSEKFSSVTKR